MNLISIFKDWFGKTNLRNAPLLFEYSNIRTFEIYIPELYKFHLMNLNVSFAMNSTVRTLNYAVFFIYWYIIYTMYAIKSKAFIKRRDCISNISLNESFINSYKFLWICLMHLREWIFTFQIMLKIPTTDFERWKMEMQQVVRDY